MEIKGITIHNTGNSKSAVDLYNELAEKNQLALCHFLVDEDKIIPCQPLIRNAWHTGKARGYGNLHTIAIEICRSTTDKYKYAQENAIRLIKQLQKEYHLTNDDIFFHNDWDKESYCPHRILGIYGSKKAFIEKELV